MLLETEKIEILAQELNLPVDIIFRESLKTFVEKKLSEINSEIFEITGKYKISSFEEFENLYKKGIIEEDYDSLKDFQKLDHLEYKRDKLKKFLKGIG